MLDTVPPEIFDRVAKLTSQEDKVCLSYVCRSVRNRIAPPLYENLFLNEKPYFPSDLDTSLGTHFWSVLYFRPGHDATTQSLTAKTKFELLVRSLQESPFHLCPLVRRVHCSWHLDDNILFQFIRLLMRYGVNLQYFSNILDERISRLLLPRASQLRSIDIVPPVRIPAGPADGLYYGKLEVMISRFDWENITELTLHVNASTFFPHLDKPLKIRSLCLNLRPDTHTGTFLEQPYYKIFDTDILEELEILSWYHVNESTANIYNLWNLHHFWNFHKIRSLTLLSLVSNESFLQKCLQNFTVLERLKIDYMFDVPVSSKTVEILANAKSSISIKYIDIKFDTSQDALMSFDPDEDSFLRLNLSCQCQKCKETFNDIIVRKIFPRSELLNLRNHRNESSREYYLQMFKFNSILPYTHFVDQTPAIGYHCSSPEDHAADINYLIRESGGSPHSRYINGSEIIRLYHAQIHSLKKSYEFFLNKFSNISFLTLNDLPTKIIEVDEFQKCNVPIFYSKGFVSNQIYELVTDQSLFE